MPFGSLTPEAALDYAAEDADITLRLWYLFKSRLGKERVVSVYEKLERPLIPILAEMEATGITVDRTILARMSNDFASLMNSLQLEIHQLAGEEFNIASPKQLGEILFVKMGLMAVKEPRQERSQHRLMYWKNWPHQESRLLPRFWNGGIWQS